MEIVLRAAVPDDVGHIGRFILASTPYLRYIFGNRVEPVLTALIRSRWSVFSWKYVRLAEVGSKVVGMLLGYAWKERSLFEDVASGMRMFLHGRGHFVRSLPYLWKLRDVTGYVNRGEYYVSNVAVAPEYRGMGIGKKLMETAFALARRKGTRAVALDVEEDNTSALNLYRRMGFVNVGVRETVLKGRRLKFLRMVRYL